MQKIDIFEIVEPSYKKVRFKFNDKFPNLFVLDYPEFGTKIYPNCNIYDTASFGRGCQVGYCTEIGNKVWIGDCVRIGAFCFIPEGVIIEDDCFIGPRVTFTNDKYPPSRKEEWQPTIVKSGARIGAGVTVLCGVEIGKNALIGAGSVVTKSVPENEVWCGVPAKPLIKEVTN